MRTRRCPSCERFFDHGESFCPHDAVPLEAWHATDPAEGRVLAGRYRLKHRLGEGGMGAVFKARNWKLGTRVALKLIHKERLANPEAVRRFQREIRAAAQLNHPNIVRALDADQVGSTHFLVMEYIADGVDLSHLVRKQGFLPIATACDHLRQAAQGLAAPTALICDTTGRPWGADYFRHVFAQVRAVAAAGAPDVGREPCPSLIAGTLQQRELEAAREVAKRFGLPPPAEPDQRELDAQFLDLRDTCVTNLARAGCSVPQIASITGHSEASAHAILKHYLALGQDLADAAIEKLVIWTEDLGLARNKGQY